MDPHGGSPGPAGTDFDALMRGQTPDGTCVVDRAGTILAVSPAIGRMVGRHGGQLVGRNGFELLHPDDVADALRDLLDDEAPAMDDFRGYRFRHADGSYVTVEVLAAEGDVAIPEAPDGYWVLTVREVTEFHHAREELARSRARRELVARIASEFVDALDDEIDEAVERTLALVGQHTGADRAYLCRIDAEQGRLWRTHGWARPAQGFASPIGAEAPTNLFSGWRDIVLRLEPVVVDDVATMNPDWVSERATLEALGIQAMVAVPLVRERALVGFLAIDRYEHAHHWRESDIEWLRVVTDMLGSAFARQDAAHESHAAEARFRTLVENSGDALIVIDRDAVISHRPLGSQLFGYTAGELVGMNALDLVHPDDLDFAASEMLRAITDPGYQATNAMRIRHRDGHWVPIELVARSYFDDPRINGLVMNVRDHSERDQFASALRVSEEQHRSLIANLPGAVYRCKATPPYHDEFLSEVVFELTGYTASEFLDGHANLDGLILDEHRARTDDELEAAIRARHPFVIEYPIRHRDGSVRWIAEHGRILFDEAGEPSHLEGFMFDITSRVEAVNEGRAVELKLANLIDNVPGVVFRCEATAPYRTIFMSDAVEDLTGSPAETFLDGTLELYDLLTPEHQQRVDAEIADQLASVGSYVVEYEITHRDGSARWIEDRGKLILDPDADMQYLDGVLMDLTDRKRLEQRLAHDAAHDPLTGLPNRTLLLDHLDSTLARGERTGTNTAVLFLDLDRFKLVNDAMGHSAGDELLIHFARRLTSVLRESDLAARTGGDEFVIVCSDLSSVDEAAAIAGRISEVLADPFTVQGRSVFVTASVGIAFAERDARADDVLRSADTAAYLAKDRGRNRYEVFDDALRAATAAALEVETDLHRALQRHELFLRYQPVVGLDSGTVLGAEALLRWQHPERGLITPDAFLPAAEASGLVIAIGREVLDLAVGALADIPAETLPTIAINLSPRELAQPDLVERVRDTLAARDIAAGRLCIEITENAVLDEVDSAVATLEALRAIGVRLAIDDFGTGYSSLSYLHRLPVDTVKIDRSFVAGLDGPDANWTIVAGIIGLGRGLGLEVVAEGVETEGQAATLRELGCHLAQGFLFSPPVTLDELLRRSHATDRDRDVRH